MKIIDFDIKKWVIMMLPTFMRGKCMIAFLQCLVSPLITLLNAFKAHRDNGLYDLGHTAQVCYLRQVLNDRFGVTTFRIEDNAIEGEWVIVYDETDVLSEQHVVVSDDDPVIVYNESLLQAPQGSFLVYVPKEVCEDIVTDKETMPIIRSLVEKYRLTSRLPLYKSL